MASKEEAVAYNKDRLAVIEDLKEAGHIASFGFDGGRIDHGKPLGFSEIATEYIFPIERSSAFQEMVSADEQVFMVSCEHDNISSCTHIKVGSDAPQKIFKIEPFAPDGVTTIFYYLLIKS